MARTLKNSKLNASKVDADLVEVADSAKVRADASKRGLAGAAAVAGLVDSSGGAISSNSAQDQAESALYKGAAEA